MHPGFGVDPFTEFGVAALFFVAVEAFVAADFVDKAGQIPLVRLDAYVAGSISGLIGEVEELVLLFGFEIAGWVRNITEQSYKTFAFDANAFSKTTVYFVGDPRTYGGTLTMRF